jgi:hypothetical protein
VVEISDASGKVLDRYVGKGRQSVSPWNAKEAVRRYLVGKGVLKPRKGEDATAYNLAVHIKNQEALNADIREESTVKTWGDHNGRNLLNDTEPLPLVYERAKNGAEPNDEGNFIFSDERIVLERKKETDPDAEIRILQLESGSFISAVAFRVGDQIHGDPLTAKSGTHKTRELAIRSGVMRILDLVDDKNRDFVKIKNWLNKVCAEYLPETKSRVSEKKTKRSEKTPVRKSSKQKQIESGERSGWDPKPPVWKSKAGDLPNSSGVYLYSDQDIVLEKKKKGPFACIHVLELETGRFISSYSYQCGSGGGSGPLSAHETFKTRAAAIEDALLSIKKGAERKQDSRADEKQFKDLSKWIESISASIPDLAAIEPKRIQLYEWLTDEELEEDLKVEEEPAPAPRKKVSKFITITPVSETKAPDPETNEQPSENLPFDLNDLP